MKTCLSRLLAASMMTMAALPALAQTPPPAAVPAAATGPSPNAMENLIRLLVAQKVITAEQGTALLGQANAEAQTAQAQIAAQTAPAAGTVRVPYVPQIVKDEIKEELRKEVMGEAKTAGWVSPNTLPDWVDRIKLSGDVRFRSESEFYPGKNTNEYLDFDAFNNTGPTDINPFTNPTGFPLLNTTRDRSNRLIVRARLALDAKVNDWVAAGVRIATGNDRSPVSTNNILGGGFSKKDLWLDRAFITVNPIKQASLTLGRMAKPFWTTELLYDEDLNFDGAALTLRTDGELGDHVSVWATGGAFPFEFQGANFPTFASDKNKTRDKWIYGGQLGLEVGSQEGISGRLAAAYYDFKNVSGELSEPCDLASGNVECSTDTSRPAFLNKGNTLFFLRNILPDPSSPTNYAQPQYLGLLFDYRLVDINAEVKARFGEHWMVTVSGDYVRNLGFHRSDICSRITADYPIGGLPVNNVSNDTNAICTGGTKYIGGNTAWQVQASLGTPTLANKGDWNIVGAYRRIESDAMLDSLNDSDFHLGGTNAKGWQLTGNYMVFDRVMLRGRYYSTNEIVGPPLGIDMLQLDLVVGF